MPVLPIPEGMSNKEIVEDAYNVLGLNDAMFGRTEEELATGMRLLRGMMEEWPYDQLGFDTGAGRITDNSGVLSKWRTVTTHELAKRVGATNNKALKPGAAKVYARVYARLCAEVATITGRGHALGTPVGSGHRMGQSTYFLDGE